jgi:flagellin
MAGRDLSSTGTGIGNLTSTSVTSLGSTALTLTAITTAIQNVATFRATNGAEQSRLGFASELLTTNKANLEAATSRITDVDVAEESTQLARWNTLVQAGTSMLTQANQSAQTALKLLQ